MPIKYVPFIPEPVEGQAVLSNFNRILKYKGADDISMSIQRGMPLYEMEKVETVGENNDGNMVIRGECVSACAYLKEQGITVDLVYIDPPFASGVDYAKKVYIRRNPKVAEAIAQAEQELDIDELKAFEEKMYGDVWDKEKYLNWMYENLMAIKSVMSDNASIFVHLDWHIGHYVKILLDEIFGESNFKNEIVWCYSVGGKGDRFFGRKHDTIYWYTRSEDYFFDGKSPFVATERKQNTHMRTKVGEDGREYQEKTDKKSGKVYRYYVDEGKIPEDYWIDIEQLNREDMEREGYATQKPERLIERIIASSADKGMLVADFFGGSGVTAAVANKLGRNFIHCDIGINSVQTTRDRLRANGAAFDVLEIKDGVQLYRNPVQTMDKIKALIPGLKNEDALDSFWEGAIADSKLGIVPVYVPNLMDSSSKLLDKVMMNRIIHQAIPDLDANIKKVIVYYIDITDEEEIYQFIRDDDSTDVEIELRDLKTVLDDIVVEDYVEFELGEVQREECKGYLTGIGKFISDRVLSKIEEFNQKAFLNSSEKKPYNPIRISEEGLELIELLSVDCTSDEGEWHSDSEIKIDKNGFVIVNGQKTKEFWDGYIFSSEKPLRLKIRNICGDETIWNI
ncbi:MAG: site-specific DNA-methyltransferase [Phascolarctobacterium sp.]|nr:site-specific DNA-methyltransferase [Phascolarctobacterium sp.]